MHFVESVCFRICYCHTYRTPMKRLFFLVLVEQERVFQHRPGLFAPTSIAHADLLWNLGEKNWTTGFFFRVAFFAHWLLESRFVARNGAKTWGASLSLCSFYGFWAATPKKCCCHLREEVQKRHVRHFLRCTWWLLCFFFKPQIDWPRKNLERDGRDPKIERLSKVRSKDKSQSIQIIQIIQIIQSQIIQR